MNNLSYYVEGSLMSQFSDLRLIEARRLAGFNTRAEVVRRFGWCRSTYDAHENGMSNFNFVTAEKYAQAFNEPTKRGDPVCQRTAHFRIYHTA